jgi:hypothetical protein
MNQKQKDIKFYIDQFKSDECICERPKKPRFAFCFNCYSRLPNDMKRALYRSFGNGFEEAYDEAYRFLNID